MFLSDKDIREEMRRGNISIDPFSEDNIEPASVDLTLGRDYLVYDHHKGPLVIAFGGNNPVYEKKEGDAINIPPNEFVLATTSEYVKISDNLVSHVEGRSSVGRMGLFIQNAGWVDPGFEGNLTLELYNANRLPIKLKAGMRICQLAFGYTKSPAENPYHGKYKGQRGTTGSKIYLDREVTGDGREN